MPVGARHLDKIFELAREQPDEKSFMSRERRRISSLGRNLTVTGGGYKTGLPSNQLCGVSMANSFAGFQLVRI